MKTPVPLLMLLALALSAQDNPTFEQFHVAQAYTGKVAPPVFRTPEDRKFRTMIRDGVKDGPNFAGHYTVAQWGCGAGCVQMALVDAADGKIYRAPFQVLGWDMMRYEGKLSSDADNFEPLAFKKDSRLLIARGCPEEKNCASYFYEWTGSEFKLLRKVAASKIPQ